MLTQVLSLAVRHTRFLLGTCLVLYGSVTAQAAPLFTGLGDLPGGSFYSQAKGVSADGAVVVGYSEHASSTEAFRWTSADGMRSCDGHPDRRLWSGKQSNGLNIE